VQSSKAWVWLCPESVCSSRARPPLFYDRDFRTHVREAPILTVIRPRMLTNQRRECSATVRCQARPY
jgi:hypothetical protein